MHLYFVFREHDRSVYFKDYFNFILDSGRLLTGYHKIFFLTGFYRGLKVSLFHRFFSNSTVVLLDYSFFFFFLFFFKNFFF
jgi:hypothetical protein